APRPGTRRVLHHLQRSPKEAFRSWLSASRVAELLESDLRAAESALEQKAISLEAQMSAFGLRRLRKDDAFRFFRALLNYDPAVTEAAHLSHDVHVDFFAADSALDCHRDHLTLGNRTVRVLSMKDPPSATFPGMLSDLYDIHGEFVACLEWQRLGSDRV